MIEKNSSPIQMLLTIILLFMVIVTNKIQAAEVSESAKARIMRYLPAKSFGLFTPAYGQKAQSSVNTGQDVILAVNTTGMINISNGIYMYYGDRNKQRLIERLVTIRIDPSLPLTARIDVADLPENFLYYRFNLPSSTVIDASGRIEIQMSFAVENNPTQFAFMAYDLIDQQADSAYAVWQGLPLKVININVGYLGDNLDDAGIVDLINEFKESFAYSTKGYASIEVNYLGRRSFPANGTQISGSDHDYLGWWNSVSHDLAGTNLAPLNPDDPQDFEKIIYSWYNDHRPQIHQDLAELFVGAEGHTVVFSELTNWAAGALVFAVAPTYTGNSNATFKEIVNGVAQYGFNPDLFTTKDLNGQVHTAKHELGHLLHAVHPSLNYWPNANDWQIQINGTLFHQSYNIMLQGNAPTDGLRKFYVDSDLDTILAERAIHAITMDIPTVETILGQIDADEVSFSGTKTDTSDIYINDQIQPQNNQSSDWQANIPLLPGANRFLATQTDNFWFSHPRMIELERYQGEALPLNSQVQLTVTNRGPGKASNIILTGQSGLGLKAMWWWVNKIENGTRQFVSGVGRWTNTYGASSLTRDYRYTLPEPGEYEICARARDINYPTPGQQNQSEINCIVFQNVRQ